MKMNKQYREADMQLNIPINSRAFHRSVCDFAISARGDVSRLFRENNVVEII
jgi:hypothetical protein